MQVSYVLLKMHMDEKEFCNYNANIKIHFIHFNNHPALQEYNQRRAGDTVLIENFTKSCSLLCGALEGLGQPHSSRVLACLSS